VILAHDRRRVVHMAVTVHPTAAWTAQQFREAFPWDQAPRYLIRDRDLAFQAVTATAKALAHLTQGSLPNLVRQMTDEPLSGPNHPPVPPHPPPPGERVWTLTKTPKRLDCDLRDDGADGWKALLFRDGEFYAARRFPDRLHALAHTTAMRALLEGGGWASFTTPLDISKGDDRNG
jgi:hypothetical protein